MRIKKAEIVGFGKWRQQTFLFEPNNQLVFGLNEAGKSTLYQFIQAILFGFPTKRKKQQDYTPTDGTGFGGRLVLQHEKYGTVTVERFKTQNKGKAKVLLNGDEAGTEELLEKILFPLNLALFLQVFTFQQEQLQKIDQLNEEQLHDALISLGLSGSNQLFDQKVALQETANQLYRPKGRKQPLNQAVQDFQQLKQKIQQKEAQEAEFQGIVKNAQLISQAVTEKEADLKQLQQEQLRLEQQRLNWENYAEYQQLLQKDLQVSGSEQQKIALNDFYQQYQQVTKEQEKLQQALKDHSGMDQNSARYYFYLENESKINQLLNQKVEIARLLDEEQRVMGQLALPLDDAFEQVPQPFTPEELDTLWQPLVLGEQQLTEQALRVKLVTEQRDQSERQLTQYEENHPELFREVKSASWVFYLIATVLFISSFFLPTPIRYVVVILAALSAVWGLKSKPRGNKEVWQERLSQQDELEGRVASAKAKLATLDQQQNALKQQLSQQANRRNLPFTMDLAAMQQTNVKAQQFVKASAQREENQQRQRVIQEQLLQFNAAFEFLTDWLPVATLPLSEKLARLETFAKEMEQIRFAQTYQENTILQQRINEAKKEEQLLREQHSTLLAEFQLSYPAEIPAFLQAQQEKTNQQLRLETLKNSLTDLFPQEITLEQIGFNSRQVQNQLQQEQESLHHLQEREQRLKLQIEQLQQDGTLDQLYQEQSEQQAKLAELLKTYSSARLESQFLQDLATELSEQQLPQLMQYAADYFGQLTNQQASLDFVEGQLVVKRASDVQNLYSLSTGTKDQVIMALRFAYLALQEKVICPIIIDDGWLHYDQTRKKQLAKLLQRFSERYQVICLSSDQEMVSYYQELHQSVWELKGVSS